MEKEKRIISYFLGWLIVGFLIYFIGATNVFAAEYYLNYDTYQRYYDNTGTLTEVNSTWNESLQSYISGNLTTVSGSTGAAWLVSSPIPMVKGHQYSISFAFVERNNIALSSKNKIAVSNTVNGAVTNYNNSSYGAETIYSKVTGNTTLSFVFKANSNSSFIVIPFTTTSSVTQNYTVTMFVMEDLGIAGLSQEELNTTINNQTNTLNNSIQNSTDTITGEIDDMEQSIIDNQNSNTDKEIESQKICDFIDKSNIKENGKFLNASGVLSNYADSGVTDFININGAEVITLTNVSAVNGIHLCYYTVNKELISCVNSATTINESLNLPQNAYYMRASILTIYNRPTYQICKNGNQGLNDSLNDLNDTLNDSNVDDSINSAGSFFDSFQTTDHGGLSGIITAPLVAINEMLNTTCNPMTATFKGKELSLPCGYDFWNKMGAIQDFLNVVLGGMLCYNIVKKLFKLIERIKNPEDDRIEVMDL